MPTKTQQHKRSTQRWHRRPRGGKNFAHYVGKKAKIRELESKIAKAEHSLGKRWNPVAYHGLKQFTPWWHSGQQKD